MIKAIALVAVLALAALLLFAASRPDTLRVERRASIQAPPEKIHPLIHDLHRFNTWNPYARKDPKLKGSYRGAASGPGAVYDFDGDQNVGKGSIEVVESIAPTRVAMKLHMSSPMEARNDIEFILVPKGEATEVTWSMRGDTPFIGKLMGVFFNMDKMIGRDFEVGLAHLKALAEPK